MAHYQNPNDDEQINIELAKVHNWLCSNRLSLNIKKTKFMIFHSHRKNIQHKIPVLKISNTDIEKVTDFNFLGITLNENLLWKSHINKIALKISKYIGILNKLKNYLPDYILKTLYDSMIASQLNYGILTWGFDLDRITNLQKKAIRTITNSKYNAHTEPLFKSLKTLKVNDLFKLNVLKFYYKHCRNELPLFLQSFQFALRSDFHNYNTRQKNMLNKHETRTVLAEKCLRHSIPLIINETDELILEKIFTHSYQGFTWYVKQKMIDSYTVECFVENCYICHLNE